MDKDQATIDLITATMQKQSLSRDPEVAAFGRIGLEVIPAFFQHYLKVRAAEGTLTKPSDFVIGAARVCGLMASFTCLNIAKPDAESQNQVETHFLMELMMEMDRNREKHQQVANLTREEIVAKVYESLNAKAI